MNQKLKVLLEECQRRGYIQPQARILGGMDGVNYTADADPAAVTMANGGIPLIATQYLDPRAINVLFAPLTAEKIFTGTMKAPRTKRVYTFRVHENVGDYTSYDDYSEEGMSSTNDNWNSREVFLGQTMVHWGQLEEELYGAALISYVADQIVSASNTIARALNTIHFYGVSGLANYGILTDPNLNARITPTTSASGKTTWEDKTPNEIMADIIKMFGQANIQLGGNIDETTPCKLTISNKVYARIKQPNEYGLTTTEMIKNSFTAMTITIAPQFSTDAGELAMLSYDNIIGTPTAEICTAERMIAGPIVVGVSNYKQKRSFGTYGCVYFNPSAIVQMIGI